MLTHFSLFSGIGGIDLAAEWAGFTTVGQVEWADYPTKVLEKHWPEVPRWRDIRELTYDKLVERTGIRTVNLISGGFPCQPFSVAGKQKGKDDNRYLWPEMLRVIREIKPTWVLGENVPGIIKIAGKTVCEDLEREGYAVAVFNFEAAAVGAPHRRDRVFFVAHSEQSRTGDNDQEACNEARGACETGRKGVRQGNRQACTGGAGTTGQDVADTNRNGTQRDKSENWQRCGVEQGSKNVANTSCKLREWDRRTWNGRSESPNSGWRAVESDVGGVASRLPCWLDGYWRVEPNIPRVATGVKNRVDRLKCLGNAVVPQQVYPILQAIAEIETR
jgi:DNA (cytosine-5)-methyltransferase 1